MIPYYIFTAIVLLIAYMAFRRAKHRPVWIIVLFIVMSLFAGMRSSQVGTDSSGYAQGFEDATYEERELDQGFAMLADEPGYYYLEKTLGGISNEYAVLFTGIAMIFSFFVLLSLCDNSVAPVLSVFVFITLGYYTFVFNAARQGIAMSIYMTAIPFLTRRKFWPYLGIVLLAALFHKSVIVAVPLYFVFTMRYSARTLILVIIFSIIVGLLLPYILLLGASLEERYAIYVEGSAKGGYLLTGFYLILTVFFIVQRKEMHKEALPKYDVFLLMLITGSAIYLVVSLTGAYVEMTRFAAYFQIGSVFLWAMLAKERRVSLNLVVYIVAVLGHLAFFTIFLTRMANLTPYLVNSNLFYLFK